ncbi:hypothetical protein [Arthrobacter sp. ISL-95]|nr:hypothetical protein [Arthrobacter sp. ISL-95]
MVLSSQAIHMLVKIVSLLEQILCAWAEVSDHGMMSVPEPNA